MRKRLIVRCSAPGCGISANWAPHRTQGRAVVVTLWLPGVALSRMVGRAVVSADTGFVAWAHIEPEFRGLRLGRRLYGEAARVSGRVLQDPHRSPSAGRVWASILTSPAWRTAVVPGYWADGQDALLARPRWPVGFSRSPHACRT